MRVAIFSSLLFLFLDFNSVKLERYNNHGCVKLKKISPTGLTCTATVGKSREPGEGEMGPHTTALLQTLNHAVISCHQQTLTFLLQQSLPVVAEGDSISRSCFRLFVSNNSCHTHQVFILWVSDEWKVSVKVWWIHPHLFGRAGDTKHNEGDVSLSAVATSLLLTTCNGSRLQTGHNLWPSTGREISRHQCRQRPFHTADIHPELEARHRLVVAPLQKVVQVVTGEGHVGRRLHWGY